MLKVSEHTQPEEKKKKQKNRIRTDLVLRETATNYIRLIGDADRKARIMLVVNSILLTIGVTLVTKSLDELPYVWISAVLLVLSNILSLFFCVQSVKPEFKKNFYHDCENNIIHYKKCSELSLLEYDARIRETMQDEDKKLSAVIKDIYFHGNLLSSKYKMLSYAYRFFSWGMSLSVISYLIMLLYYYK